MTIEVGFRVGPEVRLVTARRGPRSPVGPPVSRADTVPPDPDPDAQRFAELAGGGGREPTPRRGGERRRDRFRDVQTHLDELTSLHRAPVVLSRPPRVRDGELLRSGVEDRPERSPWMRLIRRRHRPTSPTPGPADDGAGRDAVQARADAWWERLVGNDPVTITHRLHHGLAERDLGVAVTHVGSGAVDLVFCVDPAEVLIGRWERRDGARTVSRMPRPRRHDLHAAAIGAATVAIAAQALALAPGLETVRCAAVQPDHPERIPVVLLLAELPRASVLAEEGQPPAIDDLAAAAADGHVGVDVSRDGSAGALAPLDRDDPSVAGVLQALELR